MKEKAFLYNVSTSLAILFTCLTQAQTPPVPPTYTTGTIVNFVRTFDLIAPEQNVANLLSKSIKDLRQTTYYIDGLGNLLQTVVKKGSLETATTSMADIVTPTIYDEFGREHYKYLPFVANNTGGNTSITDGNFKLNPFQQQASFMAAQYGTQGETYFYTQTNFEASPLNRPLESFAPGNNWVGTQAQPQEADRRSVKIKYWINTGADADGVRIWNVTNNATTGQFGTYSTTAAYPAGELYKTITADEHNKQVIEFKDKEGKVILKKVQIGAVADNGAGANHNPANWICTYYIYDDLNNLRAVIQPEGVKWLQANNWSLNEAAPNGPDITMLLKEQCFRYEYDQRNRMIVKKVPGAAPAYMIYDARDRLILTQSGTMSQTYYNSDISRPVQWHYTEYDQLNRPRRTALLALGYYPSFATGADLLAKNFTATFYIEDINSMYSYFAAYGLGIGNEYGPTILTETFYDNYNWAPAVGMSGSLRPYNNASFITPSTIAYPYAEPITASAATLGNVTGTKTLVMKGEYNYPVYLYNRICYDEKGRVLQTQTTNYFGGEDIITNQYAFDGRLLVSEQSHKLYDPGTTVTLTKYSYDDLGRQTSIAKSVTRGSITTGLKTIATMEYDALGQLKKKILGDPAQPLSTQSYDYNIHGWLLGVNRGFLTNTNTNTANQWFGFELGYDKNNNSAGKNFTGTQYNGNITGQVWCSIGDKVNRKYDYRYDAPNRLLKADFEQYSNGSWNKTDMDYTSYMGATGTDDGSAYDLNGNIKRMTQKGFKVGAPTASIDELSYAYFNLTNKLQSVTDAVPVPANGVAGSLGDFTDINKTGNDYGYDIAGNMVNDKNKRIDGWEWGQYGTGLDVFFTDGGIWYNHLNLPEQVLVRGHYGYIWYMYDANGNKIQKTVDETNTTTYYVGGSVYESKYFNNPQPGQVNYANKLQFFPHEEGRIRPLYNNTASPNTITGFAFDYMLKDHLGNVRMVLTEEQQSDMYPAATMEAASTTTEEALYANLNTTRIAKPVSYPVDNTTNPNANVAKVTAATGGQKVGPSITLKVMAGDQFNLKVSSWYKTNGASPGTPVTPLPDLLAALINGVSGASGGKVATTQLQSSGVLTPGTTQFLNNQTPDAARPKAYLNWILFDEQFNIAKDANGNIIASGYSGAEQVPVETAFGTVPNQTVYPHVKSNLTIDKSGYLYVYVSNETPNIDVFFDNLQVTHIRGPIVSEQHFYPFGLTMAGISSKAAGILENKKQKFQGQEFASKEFSDGSGLEMYEFKWRMDDPQTGRFWQLDPLADKYVYNSPYAFSENKVIVHRELEGLEAEYLFKKEIANTFQGAANLIDNFISYFTKSESSTVMASTPISTTSVGSSVTTNTNTNFGGNMSFLIYNNTNKGNTEPLTKTTTTVTAETKTEIRVSGVTATNKTGLSNTGVVSNEAGAKTNVVIKGLPTTVGGSVTKSSNGQTTVKAEATTNIPGSVAQGTAQVQYSTNGKQQSASIGVGGQVTTGKTTTKSVFGITFNW